MSILKHRKWLYLLSALTLGGGMLALIHYHLPLGIDFRGGTIIEVSCQKGNRLCDNTGLTLEQKRSDLNSLVYTTNLPIKSVQFGLLIDIKFPPLSESEIKTVTTRLETNHFSILRVNSVGPTISRSLTQRGLIAILSASLAIICYIAYAFRGLQAPLSSWRFGIAAIIAMVHDVGVVLGIFALLAAFKGQLFELNTEFIAAMLTVIGFSVHDTIVVFDRIRENTKDKRLQITDYRLRVGVGESFDLPTGQAGSAQGQWFEKVANYSLNQTLVRSLSTSLTTLLALLSLLLFGGPAVAPFAAALFIGIITGTYSSIFVATPLIVDWQYWKAREQNKSLVTN